MNELLHTPLSERELEILRLVAQGKANKEIASELFISVNTVKVHLAKIFQRIGVASRTEATLYAIEHEHVENPNHTLVSPQDQQSESRVELVVPETVTVERALVKLSTGEIFRKYWWAFGLALLVLVSFTVAWDRGWIFPQPTPDPILAAMKADRWKELAPMSVARANMAVTVYDNKIYVIGGETEEGVTGLTEVYDIATDTWARLPDKPTPVTNAKAVVVGGKIYVPGGSIVKNEGTNLMEFFDPQLSKWSTAENLPFAITNYALITYEGQLFLFGGTDRKEALASVLTFLPNTGQWIELQILLLPVENPFVFVQGSEVFLINQNNDSNTLMIQSANLNEIQNSTTEWKIEENKPDIPPKVHLAQVGESFFYLQSNELWKYDLFENRATPYANFGDLDVSTLLGEGNYLYFFGHNKSNQKIIAGRFQVIYTITIPLISN